MNFSCVCKGVYRSGYPNKKNLTFLKKLGLKSILCAALTMKAGTRRAIGPCTWLLDRCLCSEEIKGTTAFCEENGITIFRHEMQGNKVRDALRSSSSGEKWWLFCTRARVTAPWRVICYQEPFIGMSQEEIAA